MSSTINDEATNDHNNVSISMEAMENFLTADLNLSQISFGCDALLLLLLLKLYSNYIQ